MDLTEHLGESGRISGDDHHFEALVILHVRMELRLDQGRVRSLYPHYPWILVIAPHDDQNPFDIPLEAFHLAYVFQGRIDGGADSLRSPGEAICRLDLLESRQIFLIQGYAHYRHDESRY